MSPKGNTLSAGQVDEALSLCERGSFAEALSVVEDWQPSAERSLIEGAAFYCTAPEIAKDLLSAAIRGLPGGESKGKAQVWLARCYWATGEPREAKSILDTVEIVSDGLRFAWHLMSSIVAVDLSDINEGWEHLRKIEYLVDSVNPLWQGMFHNQRGLIQRRRNQPDNAILSYTSAIVFFEHCNNEKGETDAARTGVNLAHQYILTKQYDHALEALQRSIATFQRRKQSADWAMAQDELASLWLAQGENEKAEQSAGIAVGLLTDAERYDWLAGALLTHADALKRLHRFTECFVQLDRATEIGVRLENKELIFKALKLRKGAAETYEHETHIEMVKVALDLANGSVRKAALKIGCSHNPLDRYIKLHKIKCPPKVSKTSIIKPHN